MLKIVALDSQAKSAALDSASSSEVQFVPRDGRDGIANARLKIVLVDYGSAEYAIFQFAPEIEIQWSQIRTPCRPTDVTVGGQQASGKNVLKELNGQPSIVRRRPVLHEDHLLSHCQRHIVQIFSKDGLDEIPVSLGIQSFMVDVRSEDPSPHHSAPHIEAKPLLKLGLTVASRI